MCKSDSRFYKLRTIRISKRSYWFFFLRINDVFIDWNCFTDERFGSRVRYLSYTSTTWIPLKQTDSLNRSEVLMGPTQIVSNINFSKWIKDLIWITIIFHTAWYFASTSRPKFSHDDLYTDIDLISKFNEIFISNRKPSKHWPIVFSVPSVSISLIY